MADPTLLDTGIYSLAQAARLIGADRRSVRRWMAGHRWKYRGAHAHTAPLWKTQFAGQDFAETAIGFRDLMELRFVHAFVKAGVSLHVVKATIEVARHRWSQDYPLTTRRFCTDGRDIFESAVDEAGEDVLTDIRRKQFVFAHVIKPSLYAGIEYQGNVATLWHPPGNKGITLDPSRRFGSPILSGTSIPTDALFDAYLAEGQNRKTTARMFEIDPRQVDRAVRFEARLRA